VAYSPVDEIGFATGTGVGLRFFLPRGIGIGVEFDRLGSSPTVHRVTCARDGGGCTEEQEEDVATDTTADFTSLLLMLRGQGARWGIRIGIGRSAGRLTGRGVGVETGRNADVPPADADAGILAWSRGADGSVIVLELLRTLPVPGPFPVRLQSALRHHQVTMEGCSVGEYAPFCGSDSVTELQLGVNIGLWPVSGPGPGAAPR
jgi:hypothetical protein